MRGFRRKLFYVSAGVGTRGGATACFVRRFFFRFFFLVRSLLLLFQVQPRTLVSVLYRYREVDQLQLASAEVKARETTTEMRQ